MLWRRYLDGDESAFDEILRTLFDRLTFFIARYTESKAAAEDIAMDVFAWMIANPKHYNFKTEFKTYVFMLAKSRALNYAKRRSRIRTVQPEDAEDGLVDTRNVEDEVILTDRNRALNDALDLLADDMRAAVHLVYFEGLSYEDTAKVMHKTKKQVDNLLYRAKKELHTTLEAK